jgi:Domain of unknown function (DUF4386)
VDANRLAPLSGLAAAVLIVGSAAAAGTPPGSDAPASEVVNYYTEHDTGQIVSAVLLGLGALLVLVFAATLVTVLRRGSAASGPVVLLLSGSIVLVVGLTIFAGLSLTLGDLAGDVDDSTLRSIHVLSQELFFPVTVGVSAFFLGAGFAALRTGVLPRWLGWAALVLGVVSAVPSHVLGGALDHIGYVSFIGLCGWMLVVGVLLAMRGAET